MNNLISEIKSIELLPQDEKSVLFEKAIACIDCSSESVAYMIIYSLRNCFFSSMLAHEKAKYVSSLVQQMMLETDFTCQLIELSSIIFKNLVKKHRYNIFDSIFSLQSGLLHSPRGIVAMSMFIKNVYKMCEKPQIDRINKYISEVEIRDGLEDTVEYTKYIINREFAPSHNANILLVIPEFLSGNSFLQPPLCMMSVYATLKRNGIICDLLDNRVFSYSIEQICEIVRQNGYTYIAITSTPIDQVQNYFLDYRYSHFCRLSRALSTLITSPKIIVCGAHATVKHEFIQGTTGADIILLGEYDSQLAELLIKISTNRNISDVPNILIKRNDSYDITYIDEFVQHPASWGTQDLDYSVLPIEDYFGYVYIQNMHAKKRKWSIVQTKRGCPFSCLFCFNFYGKTVRYKNIDTLKRELKQLNSLGVEEIFFIDQTFTISIDYVKRVCKLIIDCEFTFNWSCETRADLLDEEVLALMKKAGCSAIWLGIESFDDVVLAANKKGVTCKQILRSIQMIEASGIKYMAFIMLGMFGDTSEGLKKTLDIIENKNIRLSKSIIECTPRLGTPLFDALDETTKASITDFGLLDVYRGRLSNAISSEDINDGTIRLIKLANFGRKE